MDKLLGFAPDADPTTPGVITSATNFIPYQNGMMGAPTGQNPLGVPALSAACHGATVVEKLDATRRIIAGTTSKLYELSSGSWSDVSKAGGYTGGSDTAWSFAQFGDATLAANGVDKIQRSTTGAFASISSAPIAEIVFSVGSFVMALDTSDATYGDQSDRWWCSASYDDSDWTPALSTLCTTARLVSSPGPITAGGRLGEYAVVYKKKAIYLGQYVGAPSVWDFIQVPGGEAGCIGKNAWCYIGSAHFIVGSDNFYLFDGTRPAAIGTGIVREWFFANAEPTLLYKVKCVFDRRTNSVWVFYPAVGSTVCNQAIVYHIGTERWGHCTVTIEAALDYTTSGVTIDTMNTVEVTIDEFTDYVFDSQFWLSGARALSIVNDSHQLQLMTGSTTSSGFTTGDVGDDEATSLLRKIRIRFAPGYQPTASVQMYSKQVEGDSLTTRGSGTMTDGKIDVLQSARFHRASFTFTGPARVLAVGMDLKAGGIF